MPTATRTAPDRTVRYGFAFAGVLLIAVNLRVSFVSVEPVLANISIELRSFGGLRDVSGGWTLPLLVTAGIMAVLAVTGLLAGRDRVVTGVPG